MKTQDLIKSVLTLIISLGISIVYPFSEYFLVEMTCIVALSLLLSELIFGRFKNKL